MWNVLLLFSYLWLIASYDQTSNLHKPLLMVCRSPHRVCMDSCFCNCLFGSGTFHRSVYNYIRQGCNHRIYDPTSKNNSMIQPHLDKESKQNTEHKKDTIFEWFVLRPWLWRVLMYSTKRFLYEIVNYDFMITNLKFLCLLISRFMYFYVIDVNFCKSVEILIPNLNVSLNLYLEVKKWGSSKNLSAQCLHTYSDKCNLCPRLFSDNGNKPLTAFTMTYI